MRCRMDGSSATTTGSRSRHGRGAVICATRTSTHQPSLSLRSASPSGHGVRSSADPTSGVRLPEPVPVVQRPRTAGDRVCSRVCPRCTWSRSAVGSGDASARGQRRVGTGPRSWAIYKTIMVLDVPIVAYGCAISASKENKNRSSASCGPGWVGAPGRIRTYATASGGRLAI